MSKLDAISLEQLGQVLMSPQPCPGLAETGGLALAGT